MMFSHYKLGKLCYFGNLCLSLCQITFHAADDQNALFLSKYFVFKFKNKQKET